ncbi:hypothetical protein CNY89_12565 [Amaricoccus sp. HAR-UPW-R2A-40]|nr:hypothetical protein CNY89_12565 [Amaricoccus sp. HAR-UPW-R2A-40]
MSGFTGRTHTPETKVEAAARGRSAGPRAPISDETRAKLCAARAGFKWSAESKARLAETQRRWFAEHGWKRGIFKHMTAQERADYLTLKKAGQCTRAEALRSIGRADLVEE